MNPEPGDQKSSLLDDLTYESLLFIATEVSVFRLPPRKTSAGYKAAEWDSIDDKNKWKGRMRIIEKLGGIETIEPEQRRCEIRLEDVTTGELFAASPYDISGQSVEPCLDSSRYFVIRVENKTRKAFLGIGFLERAVSFDFQVALQDWTKRQRVSPKETVANENSTHEKKAAKDWSLKESITINIGGKSGRSSSASKPITDSHTLPPLLPPPPSFKRNAANSLEAKDKNDPWS